LALESPDAFQGLILSGTALEPSGIKVPNLLLLAKILSRLFPRFAIPLRRAPYPILAQDPAVEATFHADPLSLHSVTARFATECLALIDSLQPRLESIRSPLLLLHGGADPVNALAGAQRLFERARSADKQLIVYEHNLHEPFHDTAQSQAIEDVCSWVRARIPAQ
jgi:alpha-beta hydrolase superfamily lysophospholipase